MTLRQALQMPGVYGRMVKPWDPVGPAPIRFEMVRVSADKTIVDLVKTHRRAACPVARPQADWKPMDMKLMHAGTRGVAAAIFILAGLPRDEAIRRAKGPWR